MTDLPQRRDWTKVQGQLTRKDSGAQDQDGTSLIPVRKEALQRLAEGDSLLARYKARKLSREAALSKLRELYNGEFEVAKAQVEAAVKVRKTEIALSANEYLASLEERYLLQLQEMGMQNVGARQKMLIQLTNQTTENLKVASDADWPQEARQKVISGLWTLHEKLFGDIMTELAREQSAAP